MRTRLVRQAAVVGAIIGLAGCGTAANQASSTGPAATSNVITAAPAPPTDTPTPAPQGYPIGTPVTTTTGNTFTVLAYKARVTSNNPYNTPPPGGWFAAADVKMCAGSAPLSVNSSEWSLNLADFSQIQGSGSSLVNVPGADLPFENLNPGSCISGWVSFSVPGGTVIKIQPQNSDFFWTVG